MDSRRCLGEACYDRITGRRPLPTAKTTYAGAETSRKTAIFASRRSFLPTGGGLEVHAVELIGAHLEAATFGAAAGLM